jgi:hypothetical protein
VLLAVVALGVAGCASDGDPAPPPHLSAGFDAATDQVVVRVAELRPATRVAEVRLRGPDGATLAPVAKRRSRGVRTTQGDPDLGVTARGGSATGVTPGVSLSFDLFDWFGGRETERDVHGLTVRFDAPEGYRDDPGAWHIAVTLVDPAGRRRTETLAAPPAR